MIDVAGKIEVDTVWNAELVRVVGDVAIEHGAILTIVAGARVEFQDFYGLAVRGTLVAEGTPAERIVFTTDEPELFAVDASTQGCWNGIRFDSPSAANAPSRLAYCVVEYSKAPGERGGPYPYGGGAIAVVDFSLLTIENCTFRHNVAEYGGALFLYRNASPLVVGNLIVDNHALVNAAAIYCAYSQPQIINNTIARNRIHNTANPYVESCAVLGFLSKLRLTNNIVWDNEPDIVYLHSQLWGGKAYYTHFNDIEDYGYVGDNIDADPLFVAPAGVDAIPGTFDDNFRLLATSPSIDAGDDAGLPAGYAGDLDGAARVLDGDADGGAVVDLGAFETGDCDSDGVPDAAEIAAGQTADCNGNLIPDSCEIGVHGTSLDCNVNAVPDECEAIGDGDYGGDGHVDLDDLAVLLTTLAGPDQPPTPEDARCLAALLRAFDADGDADLDLADGAAFAVLFGR